MAENDRLVAAVDELDWAQGPESAPVTLVVYGDYECPYSRKAHFATMQARSLMGDQLRLVWRQFPKTEKHPHAMKAAEAAEAAGAQGRFWEAHNLLFTRLDALEMWDPAHFAEELKIDPARFAANLEGGVYTQRVKDMIRDAKRSGVTGTPTFFINGRRYEGDYEVHHLLLALGYRPAVYEHSMSVQ